MKKLLLFKKMIIVMLLVGLSTAGWSQILYEGFEYATPAYVGGNGEPGSSSNNWVTHSITSGQTTTVNIEDGSLEYSGLATSKGNKVLVFSDANKTSRDVNRAISSTAKVLYYSALVKIVDNSQFNTTDNYFLTFGAEQGASTVTLGGRLGVRAVGSPTTNFRFIIGNISGGTPVYTANDADLTIGTTYLVVVKYDINAALTVATMWVNPATLGGAEPAGGFINNTGTNAFTSFATGSICLRNNATTPKVNIDEIRVGATFADVTPIGPVGLTKRDQASRQTSIYPNPAKSYFNLKAPAGDYQVSINNTVGSLVKTTELNSNGRIEMSDLRPGIYYVTVQNVNTNLKEVHKLIVK